jgi:serine/threonine-protein kinase HipA
MADKTSNQIPDQKRLSKQLAQHRQVFIGIEIPGQGIVTAGVLNVERSVTPGRDRSRGVFRYAPSYLNRSDAVPLDPVKMPLVGQEFSFIKFGGLPPALRDCAPDNWGRTLIERYLRSNGVTRSIAEVDYLLLSPSDRSGNLHFAVDLEQDGTPLWGQLSLEPTDLPAMAKVKEYVIEVLKKPQLDEGESYPREMDALLTAAGGARPKVTLKTPAGTYMAKLENPLSDKASMARLESASLDMARRVGIPTVESIAKGDDLYITKRFDLRPGAPRMQYLSAMTVLDASDEPYNRTNWSYSKLASELDRWSADPAADKEILFRSMVLRAVLSDSDDHPRNYALVRDPAAPSSKPGTTLGQWRLAPIFDCVVGMGQGRKATELAMEIGDHGYRITEENILSRAHFFGLNQDKAMAIMREIESRVLNEFEDVLDAHGVSTKDKGTAQQSIARLDDRPIESAIQQLMSQFSEREETRERARAMRPKA